MIRNILFYPTGEVFDLARMMMQFYIASFEEEQDEEPCELLWGYMRQNYFFAHWNNNLFSSYLCVLIQIFISKRTREL